MASILTPLQVIAGSALLNNQGLKPLPPALTAALTAFNDTDVISAYLGAVAFYMIQTYKTNNTMTELLSIGSTVCPAVGNSIPADPIGDFLNLVYPTSDSGTVTVENLPKAPYGMSGLVEQTGNAYLGTGNISQFAQGFMATQGFISVTNDYIHSAINAANYLGPTFSSMDSLITADVTAVNTNLEAFGVDLEKQGQLVDLANLDLYGTPAGLIQQISAVAGITTASIPVLQQALLSVGLTTENIRDLVTNNRQSLLNPNGLTNVQFDRLQKQAWLAMNTVGATDLDQILSILDVTTPNITSLTDLLDPVKVFPLSYQTLQTPSPSGSIPIFDSSGSVASAVAPVVNSYLPTQSGCDELGKIIPPADAVANKAIQVGLQQVSGIAQSTLPEFAEAVRSFTTQYWDATQPYLTNDVVAVGTNSNTVNAVAPGDVVTTGSAIPEFYRAQQDVPAGTNINDTNYWSPTTLGGISTLSGLPLVQNLTAPIPSSVSNFYSTSIATGSGPNGAITTCDVLGTAIDYNNLAAQFNTATSIINTLDGLGELTALKAAYNSIIGAANDGAVLGYISTANTVIVSLAAAQPVLVAELNTAFVAIAQSLSSEKGYQIRAGIDYFDTAIGEQMSTMAFVQNLPVYAQLTADCEAAEFLEDIADTTIIGGQAIIGAMREARNRTQIEGSNLFMANNVPSEPPLVPIPVVVPVQ